MFAFTVRVYWEDTDAGGVVYHSQYVNFLERARTEYLRHEGVGQSTLLDEQGGVFVVKHLDVSYVSPARLDDTLVVETQVEQLRGSSVIFQQDIVRESGQERVVLLQAQVVLVWVSADSLKPKKIPDGVRKIIRKIA